MSIPTRRTMPSSDMLTRAARPMFIRRLAQELVTQMVLPPEHLEHEGIDTIGYILGAAVDELAHACATQISLFASVMLPVHAEQSDSVSYPRDWWQACRERWLPRWWKRRHPVLYQTETITARLDMRDVLRSCLQTPTTEHPSDTVLVAPSVEFVH